MIFEMPITNLKIKKDRILKREKRIIAHCKYHKDVTCRSDCRKIWWDGGCRGIEEAKISRLYCQMVNFPIVNVKEPIPQNGMGNSIMAKYASTINKLTGNGSIENDVKLKPNTLRKEPKMAKAVASDKAAEILSAAKNENQMLKVMRQHVDKSKLEKISASVREGRSSFARCKMTCLNILRASLNKGANSPKAGKAPEKKTTEKKTTKSAKNGTRVHRNPPLA